MLTALLVAGVCAVVLMVATKRSSSATELPHEPPKADTAAVPLVHRRLHLEMMSALLAKEGGVPSVEITPSLGGVAAGHHEDGGLLPLPGQRYEQLGTTPEQLWEEAVERLCARPLGATRGLDEVWVCAGPNASAKILHTDAIDGLELDGNPIAMVPSDALLLVAGSEDDAALEALLIRAEAAFADDEYRSLVAFELSAGEWRDWLPPTRHRLEARFRAARSKTLEWDLNAMRTKLTVAHAVGLGPEQGGHLVTAWVAGAGKTVVPRADRFVLLDAQANDALRRVEVDDETFWLAYAGEPDDSASGVMAMTQFPTRHERAFMQRFPGRRSGAVSAAELDAASAVEGGLVLVPAAPDDPTRCEAVLADGRSARLTREHTDALAKCLPKEDAARFVSRAKRWTTAIDAMFASVKVDELVKNGPLMLETSVEAFAMYERGSHGAAGLLFQKLIELDPREPYYVVGLGAARMGEERYDEALVLFDQAAALNPNELAAFVNRGEIYLRQGKLLEAANDLMRAVNLDPGNKDPLTSRARVLAAAALEIAESGDPEATLRKLTGDAPQPQSEPADANAAERSRLMPVLRPPGYRKASERNLKSIAAVNGLDAQTVMPEPMTFPVADGIELELVYDLGDTMNPVWANHAAGSHAHELKRHALANLEAASLRLPEAVAAGVWVARWTDGFCASRLLLPELARQLGGDGALAAFTSTTNSFVLARADDVAALERAVAIATEHAHEIDERYAFRQALTAKPWIRGETGWTPWSTPPPALVPAIARLATQLDAARDRSLQQMENLSLQPAARA